jgi:hypothetical protein
MRSEVPSYTSTPSYSTPSIYSSNSGYSPPQVNYQAPSYPERQVQYAQRPAEQQYGASAYNGQYRPEASSSNISRQPAANMYGRREEVFSPVGDRTAERSESRSGASSAQPPAQQGTGLVGVGIIFQQYDDGNMYIKSLVPVQFLLSFFEFNRLNLLKYPFVAFICGMHVISPMLNPSCVFTDTFRTMPRFAPNTPLPNFQRQVHRFRKSLANL